MLVASDTVWPMAVGFVAKLLLGGLESYLLARNVAQLAIRRICNSIAAGLASVSLLLFVRLSTIQLLSSVARGRSSLLPVLLKWLCHGHPSETETDPIRSLA